MLFLKTKNKQTYIQTTTKGQTVLKLGLRPAGLETRVLSDVTLQQTHQKRR